MDEAGRPALFDAHTHFGQNDPDTFRQTPEELLAGLDLIGARGLVFPMHEPDGYSAANDAVLAAAAASGGKLTALCRVQPRDGQAALAEARRCMDAGAAGIKLHPRAEAFGMEEPVVGDLMELAHERRGVVLMHAGRGIPALGANTIRYAERLPDARLILAHCAISDLAWLVRELPSHPNVYIDTSWWHPADILALFCLAPPGQVLWASDSPYGLPLHSVLAVLRCALEAELSHEQLAGVFGGQLERLLRGEDAAGPRPGPRSERAAGPAAGARRRQPDRGAGPRDRRRRSEPSRSASRAWPPASATTIRRPKCSRRCCGCWTSSRSTTRRRRRDGASPTRPASSSSRWCSPARRARRCRPRRPGPSPMRATSTPSAARARAEANPLTRHPDPALAQEIERRVAVLRSCLDLSRLEGSGDTPAKVGKYYEDSRVGYRHVHSKAGAMHMALNPDGRFDRAGYEAHARLVEERFAPATDDVLELASGNGYNLGLLAERWPDIQFLGVDLVEDQVRRANDLLAERPNARTMVGDFQSLALPDDGTDCIFVVESFCHATDLATAFGEAKRVLRPGGRFIVIDAWRTDAFAAMPAGVRDAAVSVERGMAVADAQELSVWKRVANDSGLRVSEDLDLTEQIVPNLTRLARIADERLLSHPLRARVLRKVLPETLLLNAVSGYLMALTVAIGAHTYRLLMLEHA